MSTEKNCNNQLLKETRVFLNKSNSKWVTIGINPEDKVFKVDVWIGGDKCMPFKIGEDGLTDFISMLAKHPYFKEDFWVRQLV